MSRAAEITADVAPGLLRANRLLDQLRIKQEAAGFPLRLDQLLRAQALLHALDRSGFDLEAEHERLADYLAPILATSRENQRLIRGEMAHLDRQIEGTEKLPPPVPHGLRKLRWQALTKRIVPIAVAAVVLAALFALGTWLVSLIPEGPAPAQPGPAPIPQPDGTQQIGNDPQSVSYFVLGRYILPGAWALLPFVAAIFWLVRSRPRGQAALRRMTASGHQFDTLIVPKTETAIYRSGPLMRALALLRRPAVTRGARLDAATTIDRTIRSGGVPELHWRLEAKSFEYVLLCERGAPGDHMSLLADAIKARLEGARIAFTRYDLDSGIDMVRHAGGRRSGPQVEPLVQVRRRHAGARLIILGSGESLSRRFDRPETARRFTEMLDAFESPVLLSTIPAERWGWREARFEEAGVAIFAADDRGIRKAIDHVAGAEPDGRQPRAIAGGEDPLLASLHREALRYASILPPPEAEVALLVRRLRAYLADIGGFPLLAAIAAFPRTEPAITAKLAVLVDQQGHPLGSALASRLASLPWLQAGRIPDWLRLAILRSLTPAESERIRAALKLLLDDLRAKAADEATATADEAARLAILSEAGVLDQLLSRVGLGGKVVSGEGIFIRFLEGAPLDELDQPDMAARVPLSRARIAAIAGLAVVGGVATWGVPSLLRSLQLGVGDLAFIAICGGYLLLAWCLVSLLTGRAGKGAGRAFSVLHIGLYASLALIVAEGSEDAGFFVGLLTGVALLHLLVAADPDPALWTPARVSPRRWLALFVPFCAWVGAAGVERAVAPEFQTGAIASIPFAILIFILAAAVRPPSFSSIVRSLPSASTILLSLLAMTAAATAAAYYILGIVVSSAASPAQPIPAQSGLLIIFAGAYLALGLTLDRRFLKSSLLFAAGTVVMVIAFFFYIPSGLDPARDYRPGGEVPDWRIGAVATAVLGLACGSFVRETALPNLQWQGRMGRLLASPFVGTWRSLEILTARIFGGDGDGVPAEEVGEAATMTAGSAAAGTRKKPVKARRPVPE